MPLGSRAQFLVAQIDRDGVVIGGVLRLAGGLPQLGRVEVAEVDGRAHSADVDPAQDGLGPATDIDQLGYAAEFELSDPVAVNHLEAESDFPAVVHLCNAA